MYRKTPLLLFSETPWFSCTADPISALTSVQSPEYFWAISLGILIVMEISQCFIIQGSNNTGVGEVDFMQIFCFLLVGA